MNDKSGSSNANQEYSIRVPKDVKKKYHVMRFNATLGVDFSKWTSVKMERENNMKEYRSIDEESPKFGAGSEFGKEAREEARRKKLGFISRKYKPDDQPWILKAGGSLGKKFKGIREGGVSENAAYYVFTHAPDGAIEAYPLNEWYKFQPIQRYKALSAEEAEQEFGKRNKVLNYFSLMLRKRLKGDEEIESEDGDETKGKRASAASKKAKELKISDMDEWMDTSDDDDDDDDDDGSENEKNEKEKEEAKKKKVKKAADAKKKKKRDTDLEAFEDSDDGDNEGRELDYISDSSESENEPVKELKGVAEEKALRKLLTSDEGSDSDEDKSEKEENKDRDDDEKTETKEPEKEAETKKKSKKKNKKLEKLEARNKKNKKTDKDKEKSKDTSSDFSSDSTDSETDTKKNVVKKEEEKEKDSNSANSSRSASPARSSGLGGKRKQPSSSDLPPVKKPKFDTSLANYIPGSSESGITEDAVRRYLMRKPMTTIELLQKFKSKKTGLSSEKLVNVMTQILKKINPIKQTIKGKMYLSIKPS